MKALVLLAVLAGLCVAVQTNLTAVAQRALGAPVLVAISGLTTSLTALAVALTLAKPQFTGRAVGYAVGSGMLGAVIVGAIAIAAAQGGVALGPLPGHRLPTRLRPAPGRPRRLRRQPGRRRPESTRGGHDHSGRRTGREVLEGDRDHPRDAAAVDNVRSVVGLGEGLDHAAYEVNGGLIVRVSKGADPALRAAVTRRVPLRGDRPGAPRPDLRVGRRGAAGAVPGQPSPPSVTALTGKSFPRPGSGRPVGEIAKFRSRGVLPCLGYLLVPETCNLIPRWAIFL